MTWEVAVAGTLHSDDLTTPAGRRDVLGGSAVYFPLAAARYAPVHINGIVGSDTVAEYRRILADPNIDLDGMVVSDTPTFRWHAVHDFDRWVTSSELAEPGCDPEWEPVLAERSRRAEVFFVGSMDPTLQRAVIDQSAANLIGADSMTVFIEERPDEVLSLIAQVDVLFLTVAELAALTGSPDAHNTAAALCGNGRLRAVVVKRGPDGAACVTAGGIVELPASPVPELSIRPEPAMRWPAVSSDTWRSWSGRMSRSSEPRSPRASDVPPTPSWTLEPAGSAGRATYDRGLMAQRPRDLGTPIDRNLALELVRVTEGAAMAAARHMGRNQKEVADQAAVDSMRRSLGFVDMDGVVVIGEGEKDEAPMLYIGEQVGNGNPPEVDVAVDPIDGTRLVARGIPGGIATVALAERGSMFHTHLHYMEKLIVGPEAAKVIDITAPVAHNLKRIARAEDRRVEDLTVVVLDRERHEGLLEEIRSAARA